MEDGSRDVSGFISNVFFFLIGKRTRKFYFIRNISANLPRRLIGPQGTLTFLVLSPDPMWLAGAGKEPVLGGAQPRGSDFCALGGSTALETHVGSRVKGPWDLREPWGEEHQGRA